ncbi:MAG: ornithine cyclodeaminase family protein [Rhizobiales bacterium]|nr:ornithine cyclodeaminase family protein [Hyphomicrobiales bacterium]NRB15874.1 ornithine cyclodeaminase family protein [Hyphomicrobiales bacterium]
MFILSEENVKKIATEDLAFKAVTEAFVAAYELTGKIFPVVIASGCVEGNSFSIKSGNLSVQKLSGLKVGSYWAGNHLKGMANHSTTTLILNEETGVVQAVINAGYLNGLRTAAANAVATNKLARKNARTLGVLGAGHQAIFEIKAICKVRDIQKILIHSRKPQTVLKAVEQLATIGIVAESASVEAVCRAADILVTVTNSKTALFKGEWIKPGTHISAMGADQSGKQELPLELVRKAQLYADLPAQSRAIGEFELASGSTKDLKICPIGAVLVGDDEGRVNHEQITIFDSSGIALQDLCIAKTVLDKAIEQELVMEIDFS